MSVTKAVIPAGGFGTRMLPFTKAAPKEILPIINKPVIQFVIERLVNAGVKDIAIITTDREKTFREYFFKKNNKLLEKVTDKELKSSIKNLENIANLHFIKQKGPYGNGTPLLSTEKFTKGDPFIYAWSDSFIYVEKGLSSTQQLISTYKKFSGTILAGLKMEHGYDKFGFISGEKVSNVMKINKIIEKPGIKNLPSNLAVLGEMVLTFEIYKYIKDTYKSLESNQELYINFALERMLKDSKTIYFKKIERGEYYDIGIPIEFIKTQISFGLKNAETAKELRKYIKALNI